MDFMKECGHSHHDWTASKAMRVRESLNLQERQRWLMPQAYLAYF